MGLLLLGSVLIASRTDDGGNDKKTNTTTNSGAPDGTTLFADNCASCHGSNGTGNIGPNIRGKTVKQIQNTLATV